MSHLSEPYFHDEAAAYVFVESRIWPNGPVCPHCKATSRISKMGGASTRIGTYKCYTCRKPFTVKIGTIFESSHVRMQHWLQAIYLMAASKKGVSSNQLHRILGVTLKTAWFMSHRIREAMTEGGLAPFGSGGGVVEVDETFIGSAEPKARKARGWHHKNKILSLVDRNTGRAKSVVIKELTKAEIFPILRENIAREAVIHTDEANMYKTLESEFGGHEYVKHRYKEWVRDGVTTNTIEGFFSIFKRGMRGIYQHCDKQHLHRYLAEFDFRYSNRIGLGIDDAARADAALRGVVGKRLTYQTVGA